MEFEREIILDALKRTSYVQTHAANLLGISRRMLKYRMDTLGIGRPDNSTLSEHDQPMQEWTHFNTSMSHLCTYCPHVAVDNIHAQN